jgi:hypothetical protein
MDMGHGQKYKRKGKPGEHKNDGRGNGDKVWVTRGGEYRLQNATFALNGPEYSYFSFFLCWST